MDHNSLQQDPEWLRNALTYFRTKHPLYFQILKQLNPSPPTFIQLLQVGQKYEQLLLNEHCKGEVNYLNHPEASLRLSISEDKKKDFVFEPYQKAGEIARKYVKDNMPPMPQYNGIEKAEEYGEKCKNFVGRVMESRYQEVLPYLTPYHRHYMRKQMSTKRSEIRKQQQHTAQMWFIRISQTLSTDHQSRSQKRRRTTINHEDEDNDDDEEDEHSFASISFSNLLSALERVEEKCNEDLRLLQSHTPGRSDDCRLRRFTSALQTGKQMGLVYEPYRRVSQVLVNWVVEIPRDLQLANSSRIMMLIDNRRTALSPYLHEEDDSQLYQLIQVLRAQLHQDEFVCIATVLTAYFRTLLLLMITVNRRNPKGKKPCYRLEPTSHNFNLLNHLDRPYANLC